MNRRNFLQVGFSTTLGISLPDIIQANPKAKAKSIIHIFLSGGISQSDSFDYKKFNSSEYRGPFAGIETSVKGEYFGEMFPNIAKIANKMSVIRSMTHGEAAHERGTHNMFTGYKPSPALKYPSMGAVVSHELKGQFNLPPYVAIPTHPLPIADPEVAGAGFLNASFGPFGLGEDPANPNFKVRDLKMPVNETQYNRRKSMLATVDEHFSRLEKSDKLTAMDEFYSQAYNLISSKSARESFDLSAESPKLRDEYGRNPAGQRLLLARRLIESGVRFVSVAYGSWDHHSNIKQAYGANAPQFDVALARLVQDLEERGLLDSTIIVVNSEFGRTPKINASNGRDHHPKVFSTLAMGGGFAKGAFYGKSDALAGDVDEDGVSPADLTATLYHLLGIDPQKNIVTADLRPVKLVYNGSILNKII